VEKLKETIEIIGMTCTGCARALENEFIKFEGIDFFVNLAEKNITVHYFPAQYTREDFVKAIESHGYRVKGKAY
jgi:copper chaperone CopZ